VKRADSLNRDAVLKAIESGVKIEGPAGTVAIEPKTHHAALDIQLMEVKNQKLTIKQTVKQRPPSDTAQYCDLLKNPNENKQFEVKI
jgi:urea transport system substrate-binding protein